MKTKGITVWERHAEKIVLGIAAVLALAFTALQFVGQPNAVSTAGEKFTPDDVDERLEEKAEQLSARFDETAPPGVELPDPVPAADYLLSALDGSVSPRDSLLPLDPVALAPEIEGVSAGGKVEFPVPDVPAPRRMAVGQYADALEEHVLQQFPELKEYPQLAQAVENPGQPADLIFATVASYVDLAGLREQFRGADGEAEIVIPSSWYDDRPHNVVDVVIERQELVDGRWTNLKTLKPMPGQFTFRPLLSADELDATLREQVLGRLSDPAAQLELIRPSFYPTKNEDWSPPQPPVEHAAADDEEAKVDRLRRQLDESVADFQRLLRELEEAGGRRDQRGGAGAGGGDDRRAPPGGSGGGSGGRRAPPGAGGGGMGPGMGPGGPGDSGQDGRIDQRRIDQLNRRLDRIERDIARLEQQIRDLGEKPYPERQPDDPAARFALLDNDEIQVWGHDLSVEPRRTYRYRMTVRVYNPFFGKKRSLIEQQQGLAESFTLDSPAGAWSDPVRINPPLRVFITRATPPGGQVVGSIGLGRAVAEVYRFHDGRHWMHTFPVSPGDYIGGVREVRASDEQEPVTIDFNTDLFVLDIVEVVGEGSSRLRADGGGARVLLQDLADPRRRELRDPEEDRRDPHREDLKEAWDRYRRPAA